MSYDLNNDYESCLRQIARRNAFIFLYGSLFHLFLFSFSKAGSRIGIGWMTVSLIASVVGFGLTWLGRFSAWQSNRNALAVRSVRWDSLFILLMPLPFYILTFMEMPWRSAIGLIALVLQEYRMNCGTDELISMLKVRIKLRHAVFRSALTWEWMPAAAEFRSVSMTIIIGLLAMLLYNGGEPYCVPVPAGAVALREIASMLAIVLQAVMMVFVIRENYLSLSLLRYPGSAFLIRCRRFFYTIKLLPWSIYFFAIFSAGAVVMLECGEKYADGVLPVCLAAVLCGTLFFHTAYGIPSVIFNKLMRHPAQMLIVSFLLLIAIGTYFFMLPICHADDRGLSFIPALFTATSGVCITGLTVVNVAKELSQLGQLVLLVLIQLGSIGVMTISSFVAVSFSRSVSLLASSAMQDVTGEERSLLAKQLVKLVVPMTAALEAIGGVVFACYLHWHSGETWLVACWHGIFMSVNAFCNAGFALSADGSYTCYAHQPVLLLTSSVLIILGGLGCGVLAGIWRRMFSRQPFSLGPQIKMVLWTTGSLLVIGTVSMLALEYNHTMTGFSWPCKLLNSFFNTVSCRTAGFASIDLSTTHRATNVMFRILMFIGAAPGSTGGGVKVTTVAVLVLMLWSIARGQDRVVVAHRTISEVTIHRAAAVVVMNLLLILVVTMALSRMMPDISLNYLSFEVTSASSTVGLSLGLTEKLGSFGQFLIILTMFSGRIGMLTTLTMFARGKHQSSIIYPDARIQVG